ncbi:hypothetical protein Gotri_018792, partial [Gossypium trilobum]|nr:hypothetical protein [Gossypium trilobum]
VDDRVLEGFIHNLSNSPNIKIRGYLQDEGFLHASRMLGGCKLDPTLITVVVERWRPGTHTFHLPCGECTITLDDVDLQLNLSVDGSIFTGSAVVPAKYHRMRLVRIFGHSKYVGREGVVDSVRDGGDTRTGYSDATVRVEETNFVTTVRHLSTTKVGFIGEV